MSVKPGGGRGGGSGLLYGHVRKKQDFFKAFPQIFITILTKLFRFPGTRQREIQGQSSRGNLFIYNFCKIVSLFYSSNDTLPHRKQCLTYPTLLFQNDDSFGKRIFVHNMEKTVCLKVGMVHCRKMHLFLQSSLQ